MLSKTKQNIIAIFGILGLIGGVGLVGAVGQASRSTEINSVEAAPSQIETDVKIKEPVIETKTETTERVVPSETTKIQDASLEKGKTRVVAEGSNGIETYTYEVTYTDGVETDRKLIDTKVTKQPVNKVVAEGTYVAPQPTYSSCQNGTYVNSAGQTVCRPSSSNTGGATAICGDGSYSYSRSRQGTCSHHGGVAKWL